MVQEFPRDERYVRIKWLMVSRLVLVTILLGMLSFFQYEYRIYSFPARYLYFLISFVYILTGVYWSLLKFIRNAALFAYVQTGVDILLITVLVHLTGGIESGFSILYHLTIISATIINSRRGGYISASLASIFHGALLDLQYYNLLGFLRSPNYTAMQVLHLVSINILSFYAVAFLSGYLSERLRKTRQELHEKNSDFNDLQALQDHILKSIGSGILTMDLEGTITSWNPAAEKITGYSYFEIRGRLQEVFGTSIRSLFGHTDDLKERPFRFEGEIVKKDGSTAILGMVASLLQDETNSIRGIILIFQDITKIIQMEDQVRRQERLASVGSLAAGIAHEIRNPLASLSGSIQVLQAELDLKGDNGHLMEIVVRETDRLNTIITEFLEYARPKAGGSEQISLSSMLEETCTLLLNNKEFGQGLEIKCDISPDIALRGDGQRLRQVFWNLLINACQAMPLGGEIRVSARTFTHFDRDTPWCEIQIADDGPGIAHEDLSKIFDPFFTSKNGGTGLGLAIVYRIIEDHGGTIYAQSSPGRGATFLVRLPKSDETSAPFIRSALSRRSINNGGPGTTEL